MKFEINKYSIDVVGEKSKCKHKTIPEAHIDTTVSNRAESIKFVIFESVYSVCIG